MGCSLPLPEGATPTPFEPTSVEGLHSALRSAADDVRLGETVASPVLDVVGQELLVGDERVEVYPYTSNAARRAAQEGLLESGSLEPGVHVWGAGPLLVVYPGADGGTVLLLSGLLDDPITVSGGQQAPYPPAVTAAIRRVADREDVAPGRVQVLEFEEQTWPDRCLGLPREGESCEEETVEGWRVWLQVDGSTFVVRTDAMGFETRLR